MHICFTGVIPQGSHPERHLVWLKARMHGAVCHNTLSHDITHLVAGVRGTDKINAAMASFPGIYIVSPNWLDECYAQVCKRFELKSRILTF